MSDVQIKDNTVALYVKIPEEYHRQLKHITVEEKISLSKLVTQMIEVYLEGRSIQ